mmetsp:Transcript_8378/g.18111  ORF Transcript_8378/g.18111 Transcript_8378/m.18111 type:complete len:447 (-) Transcript_8378:36-1376(-)
MTEGTPLLLDSRSPPTTLSALSRDTFRQSSNRRRGGYPAGMTRSSSRSQKTRPVHVHAMSSPTDPYSSSSRQLSRSAPPASSRRLSSTTTTSSPRPTRGGPNKLWQTLVSLPHACCCFTNSACAPLCGLCCCVSCVRENQYGVLERFGSFERILRPGMHFLKWPMEREAGRIGMRIRQLDVDCETKSRDHVILHVRVSIQYQTNSTHLFESFYSLSSPVRMLTTHAHDILRSALPCKDLDDIFLDQDSVASELHRSLNGTMNEYGYIIHHALITEINPNGHVKASMNEMEASKRMKQAMPQKAEAVKIQAVKEAEARAERAHLNGVGVARERGAIAKGMKEVAESALGDRSGAASTRVSAKGVMDLLLLTQYFDVLNDLKGVRGVCRVGDDDSDVEGVGPDDRGPSASLFMDHLPGTVTQLTETARRCFGDATSDDTVKVGNLLEL